MGSFFANFITIVILSIVTFVVLDINQNDIFEKTTTAKYLNKIGATPYVNRSILTIKQSKWFNQYIVPNWNSVIRFLRPHVVAYKTQVLKYFNFAVVWCQKNSVTFVDYVDGTVVPTVKEYSSRYWIIVQTYFNRVYTIASEYTLVTSNWLGKNVFAKLPQEEIQKAFVNLVASTQKAAIDSYDWVSGQVQKLIV